MAEQLIASDSFTRTSAAGWGTATLGGAWTGTGSLANTGYSSVSGGIGAITINAGGGGTMLLNAVPVLDSRAEVTYSLMAAPSDGTRYVGIDSRVVGASNYRVSALHRNDGSTWITIAKDGSGTPLQTLTTGVAAWTAGAKYHIKVEVVGSASVTIRAKVWADTVAEPSSWLLSHTEAPTGTLGSAHPTGIYCYRSGTGTAGAQAVNFDDYALTDLSVPEPAASRMYVGSRLVTAAYVGIVPAYAQQ